jgi:putative transposase
MPVMREHVHLLLGELERSTLAVAIQMLKQMVSRKIHQHGPRLPVSPERATGEPFWQRRYYDFNVWSKKKLQEKVHYIHQNPVRRGLVARPEDWKWSSFRHIATGEDGVVEIESQWTARKRERLGIVPRVNVRKN